MVCARLLAKAGCEKPRIGPDGVQFMRPMFSQWTAIG